MKLDPFFVSYSKISFWQLKDFNIRALKNMRFKIRHQISLMVQWLILAHSRGHEFPGLGTFHVPWGSQAWSTATGAHTANERPSTAQK